MTSVADEVRPLDRRVRRTQRALRDAFISLVLERGYDHVLVEDITERADVARATFYAHYSDKDELFATLFAEFSSEVTALMADETVPPDAIRTHVIQALYEDAYAARDLYRLCLGGAGNGRARASFEKTLCDAVTRRLSGRISTEGYEPRVPLQMIARAFSGAVAALLEMWLAEDDPIPAREAAALHMRLIIYGQAWALGMVSDGVIAEMPKV